MKTLKLDKLRIKHWPIPRNNAKKFAEFLDSNIFTTKSARLAKYSKKWNTFLIYKVRQNKKSLRCVGTITCTNCFVWFGFYITLKNKENPAGVIKCSSVNFSYLTVLCLPLSPGPKYVDHTLTLAGDGRHRGGACTASAITKAQSGVRGSWRLPLNYIEKLQIVTTVTCQHHNRALIFVAREDNAMLLR